MFFIALFHVLDYLDQFKAIKENLLRGVGHPLRRSGIQAPPPGTFSKGSRLGMMLKFGMQAFLRLRNTIPLHPPLTKLNPIACGGETKN